MDKIVYDSSDIKKNELAEQYLKTDNASHRFLAYRDLPDLICKHLGENYTGKKALDFGMGTGISSQVLMNLGFDVDGADVSEGMLSQAKLSYPNMKFHLIENGILNTPDNYYDFIFSSFVLFELADEDTLREYLSEARRVLKPGGVMIAITGSEVMHSSKSNWLIFGTDFSENIELYSGKKVKAFHYESGIEFTDYFWRDNDYKYAIENAGLNLIYKHTPLGQDFEPYEWKDELNISPFSIYVLKKDLEIN